MYNDVFNEEHNHVHEELVEDSLEDRVEAELVREEMADDLADLGSDLVDEEALDTAVEAEIEDSKFERGSELKSEFDFEGLAENNPDYLGPDLSEDYHESVVLAEVEPENLDSVLEEGLDEDLEEVVDDESEDAKAARLESALDRISIKFDDDSKAKTYLGGSDKYGSNYDTNDSSKKMGKPKPQQPFPKIKVGRGPRRYRSPVQNQETIFRGKGYVTNRGNYKS